jgi:nucleoside 2-deoxyribosyltransferase
MSHFYLASGFSRRDRLRSLAKMLQRKGHEVTSGWIQYNTRPDRDSPEWEAFAQKVAGENLIDLSMSDALIIDAFGIRETNNGGVHTELGFAIAKDWPIYLIGPRRNTFTWLPQVRQVANEEELLQLL